MKRTSLLLVLSVLSLAACSNGLSVGSELKEKIENPLYAKRYYEDLVDHMVNLEIQNDPLTASGATKEIIEDTRITAVEKAKDANAKRQKGLNGTIISDMGYAHGIVLVLDDSLFLGPDFSVTPGVDLHVYTSTVLDPRDAPFPDATAVDMGSLKEAYGAQEYDFPSPPENQPAYRTFVLWDRALNRIYGFAQLQSW